MSKKTYTVDAQFILDGHKSACSAWKTKIENKFPQLFPKEMTYKIGQKFKNRQGSTYMLVQSSKTSTETLANLINLSTGNAWSYAKPVKSTSRITQAELDNIFDAGPLEFTLIED